MLSNARANICRRARPGVIDRRFPERFEAAHVKLLERHFGTGLDFGRAGRTGRALASRGGSRPARNLLLLPDDAAHFNALAHV